MKDNFNNTQHVAITNKESNWQILKDVSSNFISSLSSNMFTYGLGLMLLDQTGLAISFGIGMIITPIVGLLFLIPVGNLTDRYPHKKILTYSIAARFIALIIFAFTIDRFHYLYKLIPVIIFLSINAISLNFSNTSYSASVRELVNKNKIQKLSSLTQGAASLSAILSPAIGVALYSTVGFEIFIYIEIFAALSTFIILQTMHFHYGQPLNKSVEGASFKNFKVGLQYIKHRKLIKVILIVALVINFIFTALNLGIPYVIKNQLHLGNAPVGYLQSGVAIGTLAGSLLMLLVPEKKWFVPKLILPLLSFGVEFILLGVIFLNSLNSMQLIIWGTVIMVLIGLSVASLNITIQVRLQKTVPTYLLGRVMALLTTANTSVMPLGTLFYTFLFQVNFKGGYLFVINGIVMLAYTTLLLTKLFDAIRSERVTSKNKNYSA
ncbi:MFS transporter [Liquorilactobacillus satsumensis]|uniref:MFS transporter n=1 Tax=Liquorilactobacillus satsumensis TaxID=259059 RepID=UPI001E2FE763|nr:MFS transporter [Liquorilactobacillus satsumensis]MCC7666219.1 MFS transporter [Liquorilactobacillus satsumensis]